MFRRLVSLVLGPALAVPLIVGSAAPARSTLPEHVSAKRVCAQASHGSAACLARVVTKKDSAEPLATSGPYGLTPADIRAAYGLDAAAASRGAGQTIAIIVAFDNAVAESDLAVYRSTFGLPACTSADGCFRKVDQRGGTSYPAGSATWGAEASLDLAMASAVCPLCNLLLVEADTNTFVNLGEAVNTAARLGATVINNSYGSVEFTGEDAYESYFNHPGVAITVASGDDGYGAGWPAASRYVTAVGGTSLRRDTSARGWTESAWSRAGSGCSRSIPRPSWQPTVCSKRAVADVAAVADPSTGVAVYNSYYGPGWMVMGGTSASAPIIAGVYALSGRASSVAWASSLPYANPSALYDVTAGSNGSCTKKLKSLCTAGPGFDGPTGLGTPHGIGAF